MKTSTEVILGRRAAVTAMTDGPVTFPERDRVAGVRGEAGC